MRTTHARSVPSFLVAYALLYYAILPALAATWKPEEDLEIVATDGPEDGTDQLVRLVQSAISQNKLLDISTAVLNKDGGNGAETFLDLKLARGNTYKLVVGTNSVYLLPSVTRLSYQWADLASVATVAEDGFILWTYQAAPWADVAAFFAGLKKDAAGMHFGGSQSKNVDRTLSLLLGKQAGDKPTYVSFGSGNEASIQLAGRHIAVSLNNPAENLSRWCDGQVRPLCVSSHGRMIYTARVATEQFWADIPACHEQGPGIDQYRFPRTMFLPGGVNDEQHAFYVELMRKVSQTGKSRDYVGHSTLVPTFLADEDLVSYIGKDRQRAIPLFREAGWLRQ